MAIGTVTIKATAGVEQRSGSEPDPLFFWLVGLPGAGRTSQVADTADARPGRKLAPAEPARIHFERIARRPGGTMIGFGFRRHFLDIENRPLLVDERHRKRDQRVAHPHAMAGRLVENKQHAAIGRQLPPVHQPLGTRGKIARHLGFDAVDASRQLDARHRRLGDCRATDRSEQQAEYSESAIAAGKDCRHGNQAGTKGAIINA